MKNSIRKTTSTLINCLTAACIFLLFLSVTSCEDDSVLANKPDPTTEKQAIGNQLTTLAEGFANLNAQQATTIYTPTSEWLNAFGEYEEGKEAIRNSLEQAFSASQYQDGNLTGEPTAKIRILKPGVAVAWTYQEIEGQRFPNGDIIPIRKVHSLLVFIKKNGEWLVEAQIFMDEHLNPNKQNAS